jgi:ribonuclease HII
MEYPNLNEEKKLWKKGYKRVACLDEAGRGSLAGPVVVAVVMIKKFSIFNFQFLKIRDSKKLTPKKREELYKFLKKCSDIEFAVVKVSEKIIDKINILEATKLAMKRAVEKLKVKPECLILDGRTKINVKIPQKTIIGADEKVFSCACASIIAKVTRDRLMKRIHKKYPNYGFDNHKGYGTKMHKKMLRKYGPCKIHRKSFRPVKQF